MTVIQIIGLVNGEPTPFDGQYIVEYDPSRDGESPSDQQPMTCVLRTTPTRADALQLTQAQAFDLWRSVDKREPVRADGKPNRPLTAFTVTFL